MGPRWRADLIAFRPFEDWSDLLTKVGGLGKGYREAMEPFITFGPESSNVEQEPGEPVGGVDEDPDEIEEPEKPQEEPVAPKARRRKRTRAA